MPKGICQLYTGSTCEPFLKNQTVFVPPHLTLEILEDNLKTAYYGVIKESKDMNPNCRGYALPSLCFSVLPICRTPEKTNHQYFRNIAVEKEKERLRKLELAAAAAAAALQTTTIKVTESPISTTTKLTPVPTFKSIVIVDPSIHQNIKKSNAHTNLTESPIITIRPSSLATITTATTPIESITTVKSRPKKSQKPKDRKSKKHSQHSAAAAAIADENQQPTSSIPLQQHANDDGDIDEIAKRSRRFLDDIMDQQINFRHKMSEHFVHNAQHVQVLPLSYSHSMIYSVDSNYPPARSTSNLRRICRNECELLENELCQKEYAIAKRHPAIGQVLPIEDCFNLPEETNDCSSLGLKIDVDEKEDCYWENGSKYRGTIAVSRSGKPCLTWVRLMKEIADFPELAGQNYCRYAN